MKVATIRLDIAKQVFQVHGAIKAGRTVLRRKLRRNEVGHFFSELEPCVVGIEASGSAHYWARVLGGFGHTVRLTVLIGGLAQRQVAVPAVCMHGAAGRDALLDKRNQSG
jgi:hypothetical protein